MDLIIQKFCYTPEELMQGAQHTLMLDNQCFLFAYNMLPNGRKIKSFHNLYTVQPLYLFLLNEGKIIDKLILPAYYDRYEVVDIQNSQCLIEFPSQEGCKDYSNYTINKNIIKLS